MKNIFKTKKELLNYLKENNSELIEQRNNYGRFGSVIENKCIINNIEYEVKKVKSKYFNEWVWIINIDELLNIELEQLATKFIREN